MVTLKLNPTALEDRIAILDVLRGFALGGILLANLVSFAGYYVALSFPQVQALPWIDRAILFLIDWLVEGKFYSLFSILFGIGFYLQYDRATRAGASFLPVWYRRMLVLLLFGLLHMFFIWYGDILTLYALLGLSLPLFISLRRKQLAWVILVLLSLPLVLHALQVVTPTHEFWRLAARFAAQLKADMGYGSLSSFEMLTSNQASEVWAANMLGAIQRPMSYLRSGRYFHVLGLFLLGLWLARYLLPQLREGKPPSFKSWLLCALTGLITSFVYAWIKAVTGTPFATNTTGLLQGVVYHVGSTSLALAYIGAFIAVWQKGFCAKLFDNIALPGRMALTSYISQNTLGVVLFYGYGMRLLGQFPYAMIPVLAALILITQWMFCRLWFRYFKQGPLEYLWRTLTYRKLLSN